MDLQKIIGVCPLPACCKPQAALSERIMKILLISLHHLEYAIELAQALGAHHTVHLILSEHRVTKVSGGTTDPRKILKGPFSYTLLKRYNGWNPLLFNNFLTLTKVMHVFKPDVIHMQESSDFSNFFLIFSSAPIVATVHDVNVHPGDKVKAFWNTIAKIFRKYVYRKVIVHGTHLKEIFLKGINRSSDDVCVIPHGSLFSFHNGHRNSAPEDHTVLFFGRMHEYKGLKYLMEAEPLVSREVPDFKVVIAGTGYDLTLNKQVIQGNPHFEIHDRFIPNQEVAAFFKRSAVVVTPYTEASQSGIAAMAFAFGKPVIATNVGSMAEMIEHGTTGLIIPPSDAGELSRAILSLLKNKHRRKAMGEKAFKRATSHFSWNCIADMTLETYRKALV